MNKLILLILITALISCSRNNSKKEETFTVENNNLQDSVNKEHIVKISNVVEEKLRIDVIPDSLKIKMQSTRKYEVSESSISEFIAALQKESPDFIADTLKYIKENGQIKLPVYNKTLKEVIFKDTLNDETDNPDFRVYKYLGHYPFLKYYLVKGEFYEYLQYYLIDQVNGQKMAIGGNAKSSPNKSLLVNINEIGGYGEEPIGYQIWRINIENRKINKIIEFDQYEWYPVDFVWEADNSLILKIISMKSPDYQKGEGFKNSNHCQYKKLRLK